MPNPLIIYCWNKRNIYIKIVWHQTVPCLVPHTKKTAATYSPALRSSTIGARGLNFSVRDGKRWNPAAIAT